MKRENTVNSNPVNNRLHYKVTWTNIISTQIPYVRLLTSAKRVSDLPCIMGNKVIDTKNPETISGIYRQIYSLKQFNKILYKIDQQEKFSIFK